MSVIEFVRHVANSSPQQEGRGLALMVLKSPDWTDLAIDVVHVPAHILISAFFNSFLQTVYEEAPERLEAARAIQWKLRFDFQRQSLEEWMRSYKPFVHYDAEAHRKAEEKRMTDLLDGLVRSRDLTGYIMDAPRDAMEDGDCVLVLLFPSGRTLRVSAASAGGDGLLIVRG